MLCPYCDQPISPQDSRCWNCRMLLVPSAPARSRRARSEVWDTVETIVQTLSAGLVIGGIIFALVALKEFAVFGDGIASIIRFIFVVIVPYAIGRASLAIGFWVGLYHQLPSWHTVRGELKFFVGAISVVVLVIQFVELEHPAQYGLIHAECHFLRLTETGKLCFRLESVLDDPWPSLVASMLLATLAIRTWRSGRTYIAADLFPLAAVVLGSIGMFRFVVGVVEESTPLAYIYSGTGFLVAAIALFWIERNAEETSLKRWFPVRKKSEVRSYREMLEDDARRVRNADRYMEQEIAEREAELLKKSHTDENEHHD